MHARSIVAAAIDGVSGEVFKARLAPSYVEVLDWIGRLPGPCAVAYESGPTGFGLARTLRAAGLRCEVAASSKLQRPAGDRVKTDARDARQLARLLRLDEIVSVRIPSPAEEAARDLVRAREASRADLMRARHRLSKLLLRHGIVYSGGKAWTELHDRWLRQQRFDSMPTQAAFDDAYETVVLATARRARLDEKITVLAEDSEFTAVTRRLACLRGIAALTGFALAVEIGDWHRFTGLRAGAGGPCRLPAAACDRRDPAHVPAAPHRREADHRHRAHRTRFRLRCVRVDDRRPAGPRRVAAHWGENGDLVGL
ncbi:MAG TPA: transposase [Amycolatopsis sp.]|nr:transposase [Amycolatopsis sp.]